MTQFYTCASHLVKMGDNAKYFMPGETINIVSSVKCQDCKREAITPPIKLYVRPGWASVPTK